MRMKKTVVIAFAVLAANLAPALHAQSAALPAVARAIDEVVPVSGPDGRTVDILIVASAQPKGVLLVSHGGNSSPAAMRAVFDQAASEGFAVVAPTHTDSLSLAAERRTDLQGAFATRIADMQVAAGLVAQRFPGLPIGALGYSYGSLTALIAAGGLSPMIPGEVPGLKAAVMFSSPGPIAGLTDMPGAFAAVDVPVLLVTGTADTVPGFVSDPARHLVYFDSLPAGDRTALVVKDATHLFLAGREPGMEEVAPLVLDFLRGRVLDEEAAGQRYDAADSTAQFEVRRR